MPSATKHQSRLNQIRRINERAPMYYYFNAWIRNKEGEWEIYYFAPDPHLTPAEKNKAISRLSRFVRRAMQCKRFAPAKPFGLQS